MLKAKYLKFFQDMIGPQKFWPRSIRMCVYGKTHLTNQERFKVTVFFLANGLSPYQIKKFYEDCYKFDYSAIRQIEFIIKKYPTSNWKAWSIKANKSI